MQFKTHLHNIQEKNNRVLVTLLISMESTMSVGGENNFKIQHERNYGLTSSGKKSLAMKTFLKKLPNTVNRTSKSLKHLKDF